jgi:hypothetical protein
MDRFFTIENMNGFKNEGEGHYKASTPIMAAKKIANKLCNVHKMDNKIIFGIRETTKTSKKNLSLYCC